MRRRNSNYWRGDSWGGNAEIYPKFKVVCESENHIGYINAPPKEEYRNPVGYKQIDEELHRITHLRISYIQIIEQNGLTKTVYKRPEDKRPESDLHWNKILKMGSNRRNIIFLFLGKHGIDNSELLKPFLKKYFSDPSGGPELFITFEEDMSGPDVGNSLQKKKHHNRYNLPQKASQTSPIEKLFRDELQRRGIDFEEQVDFILDGKKFSVPDFVIREANLIIYCDGTEFHKSPERIIMDKQQDRALQANGFTVFRFSGSEIASSVKNCVYEVEMFIQRKNNPEDIHDLIARQAKKQE